MAHYKKISKYTQLIHTTLQENTSVTRVIGPSVTTSSTDFSFQNLVFWNLFEFSAIEFT
jgi:hypothetical protein